MDKLNNFRNFKTRRQTETNEGDIVFSGKATLSVEEEWHAGSAFWWRGIGLLVVLREKFMESARREGHVEDPVSDACKRAMHAIFS